MKSADGLDPVDRKILAHLAADARISMSDLSRRVNLSRPAVQARVARLEATGVIRGYRAEIRNVAPGTGHRAILLATIGVRPCAPALAYLRAQPEVCRLWSVAGPHDAMIEVLTEDPAALSAFTDRLAASPHGIAAVGHTVLDAFDGPAMQDVPFSDDAPWE